MSWEVSGIFFIKFGHIGENHLHVNLLPKNEAEQKIAKDTILNYARKGINLGGTVSAEHGIGKIKHQYLNFTEEVLKVLFAVAPRL